MCILFLDVIFLNFTPNPGDFAFTVLNPPLYNECVTEKYWSTLCKGFDIVDLLAETFLLGIVNRYSVILFQYEFDWDFLRGCMNLSKFIKYLLYSYSYIFSLTIAWYYYFVQFITRGDVVYGFDFSYLTDFLFVYTWMTRWKCKYTADEI